MKKLGIFTIYFLCNLFFMMIGPLFMFVPIFGFIPIFIGSFLIFLFRHKTYLELVSLSFLLSLVMFILLFNSKGLDFIAVGMMFHSIGIILANLASPFILKKLG